MAIEHQLLVSLLGGVIGGFGAKFLWNYYRRPILEIRGLNGRTATDEAGDIINAEYSIEVHNKGKSAANNCRARLRLEGRYDRTIDTSDTEGLGEYEHMAKGYEASYNLPWREGAKPESMTINRGETVELDLVTVDAGRAGPEPYSHLQFPQDPAREDATGPIQKREWGIDQGNNPVVTMVDRISREDIEQISWQTMTIEFSGENTQMTSRLLDVTWDRNIIPDITLTETNSFKERSALAILRPYTSSTN